HEDKLALEDLAKYSALLLPNTALLSDEQCRQLRAYVDAGGSLLATFETSMYTERNERRFDFGLADVFGIRKTGDIIGTAGNAYLARIEKQHAILNGFSGTNWIPGAENRIPVAPVDGPLLTVVPGFVAYPPELSYPLQARTNEPAVVVRQKGKSRLIYFPGDIERTMWRSGHTDLARLLQNSIRWVAGANPPVTIQGDGVIEAFAWETQAGFAVHILNYTNPAMHRGWIRNFYPIGDQKVRMSLPQGRRVTRVELLRAGGAPGRPPRRAGAAPSRASPTDDHGKPAATRGPVRDGHGAESLHVGWCHGRPPTRSERLLDGPGRPLVQSSASR